MPHVPLEVRRFRDEIYQSSFGFKLNEELEGDPDGPLTRLLLNTEEGQSAGKLRQLVEKAAKYRTTLELEFGLLVDFPLSCADLEEAFTALVKEIGVEVANKFTEETFNTISTKNCDALKCLKLLEPLVKNWREVGATLFIYAIPKE